MSDQIDGGRSTSFMRLFGQMVMLPVTVFVQSMELVIKTIQGMQRAADNGLEAMVDSVPVKGTASVDEGNCLSGTTNSETCGTTNAATTPKETNMTDRDLSGKNTLKLVRYKILFIKRDYEVAFPEAEELVTEAMDDTAYTAWKIAEFIQRLGNTPVPSKWGAGKDWQDGKNPAAKPKYPPPDDPKFKDNRWVVDRLPEGDKKYLRVYFEVLDRYDREEFKYQERQIEVLEEIRDRI